MDVFERNLLRVVNLSSFHFIILTKIESEKEDLDRPFDLKQTVPPEIVTQTTRSLLTPFRSPQTLDQPRGVSG